MVTAVRGPKKSRAPTRKSLADFGAELLPICGDFKETGDMGIYDDYI